MPFDPTPAEVSRNGVEIGKLRVLSEALRAEMPEGFSWKFNTTLAETHCGTVGCAIGLAITTGLIKHEEAYFQGRHTARAPFGLKHCTYDSVFYNIARYRKGWDKVRPADVAVQIDRIIAREEAASL